MKPSLGARIDGSHPLAQGLAAYEYLPAASRYPVERVRGRMGTAWGLAWGWSPDGIGIWGGALAADGLLAIDPLNGLASFALVSWFYTSSRVALGAQASLGWGRWNDPNYVLNRVESATESRAIATFSGGDLDLTITDSFVDGYNALCWNVRNAVMEGWTNGVLRATSTASSGTMGSNGGGWTLFNGESAQQPFGGGGVGAGLGAALYTRALSSTEIQAWHRNPYAVLRRPRRARAVAKPAAAPTEPAGAGGAFHQVIQRVRWRR